MKNPAPLQLQRISVFMPQRLRDDEVRQLFIMRQDVFQTLLDSIKAESKGSIPQHHLIIGQRGMGKTTLLKRLDVELRGTTLSRTYIPFTFPEEQYNIDRLSKFWLNSLDALADTLQSEGDEKTAFQLDEQIAALAAIRNEQELSQKAYETLREAAKTLGRRPVFLLDNLNLIFDRLGEVEQSKLRKVITEPGAPIFIGASPEAFDEDLQYDAPFYDAFAVHFLYKLDFPQTLTMLRHLAEITDQRTLLSQLTGDNIPRLETLHMLTGGNVRTVVILFSLVAQGFSADVFQDLEALIDQMTPLYKSRFEELSPQAQVVVDAVALNWDPCKLETLRERTSLENNQLSVQLDRLGKAGWVNKLGKRKAANYEISERFFNIWYLMRRATRRQRRDLLWLTRFLQAWFTRPELVQQAKQFMRNVHEREKEYELAYGLALARALPNKVGEQLKEKIYQRLLNLVDGDIERLEEMVGVNMDEVSNDIVEEFKINKSYKYWKEGWLLFGRNKFEEAKISFATAVELNEKFVYAWYGLGESYIKMMLLDKALDAYRKAIEIDSSRIESWVKLGEFFATQTNNVEEAKKAYDKAISIEPNSIYAWLAYGDFLRKSLHDYTASEKAYEKALGIDNDDRDTLIKLAELYDEELGNSLKAERFFMRAILSDDTGIAALSSYYLFLLKNERIDEVTSMPNPFDTQKREETGYKIYLSSVLQKLGMFEEAKETLTKYIEINGGDSMILTELGLLYHYKIKDYSEAEKYYKQAIELKYNSAAIINLVFLLRDIRHKIEEAYFYFQKFKTGIVDHSIYLLNRASFLEYNKDWENAREFWYQALSVIDASVTYKNTNLWYHSAAVAVRLGYGKELLSVFRSTEQDKVSRPFYEAVKALTLNSGEYLKTEVAAEVREVALQIFKFMQDYNAPVS